jgi:hypothetical protein
MRIASVNVWRCTACGRTVEGIGRRAWCRERLRVDGILRRPCHGRMVLVKRQGNLGL